MTLLSRLPRPILALLAAFGLIAALQATPALAPAESALAPAPAAAAGTSSRMCVSVDSTDHHRIRIYDSVPGGWYYYVGYGNCSPWISLEGALVNTCPDGNTFNYYQYKYPGGSYGTKHYGCNPDSNPSNVNGTIYIKLTN